MGNRVGKKTKERGAWWESHPLIYDSWGAQPLACEPGTLEYFREIDGRFFRAADFAQKSGEPPFASLIPYERLKGKRVLDLGCGAGAHAEQILRCGAHVTACDLTRRAVDLTGKRFRINELPGDAARADGTQLPFDDESFDFVWSWGVIHHSRSLERCVAEIARVLRPGGETRVMVYNRDSIGYWVNIIALKGLLFGGLATMTADRLADEHSDGDATTFWTARAIRAVFSEFFDDVRVHIFGQRNEALPVPRRIRDPILKVVPLGLTRFILNRVGAFLFVIGKKH